MGFGFKKKMTLKYVEKLRNSRLKSKFTVSYEKRVYHIFQTRNIY